MIACDDCKHGAHLHKGKRYSLRGVLVTDDVCTAAFCDCTGFVHAKVKENTL